MVEIEKGILKIDENDQTTSTRFMSAQLDVAAYSQVWKALRLEQFYFYDYLHVRYNPTIILEQLNVVSGFYVSTTQMEILLNLF